MNYYTAIYPAQIPETIQKVINLVKWRKTNDEQNTD